MISKKDNRGFEPVIAIPPGATIRENMGFLGMNQRELAVRLDITEKHLSNILNDKAPITYEVALKLESVIGPTAEFWMNLEINYQLTKVRLKNQEDFEQELEILKEIPYSEMSRLGWVEKTKDIHEKIANCKGFFGVAHLALIKPTFDAAVMYRKQKQLKGISDLGVLAWLRKAELEGVSREVNKFSKRKIKTLIPAFRNLTMKENFYSEMIELCAECGILLVLVEYLSKTYICGAVLWKKENPIIALSLRGKRADVFWFTFFHELAHILEHSPRVVHIDYEKECEQDANKIAEKYLIPDEQYKEFIKRYDYKDKQQIINYSHKIGIAPFILLGRLQHDRYISYNAHSDLIPQLEISRV
jgi:HTH-type transcriptional regulator/antitoxin HigA